MAIEPGGRGPELSGVVGAFLALSTVAIVLRAYCRAFVVKSFGFDDWFAVIAYIFFVFFCAFAITGVHHGTGQHFKDIIPATEIPVGLKWWWACEPVYVLSNMALKISIGVMLLRLTVKQIHHIVIWITLAITEIYGAFFFFLFVFQCRPSSYFWTQYTGASGSCVNPKITVNATYGYSAVSCAGDWTFAIIPMFLVWDLKMNPRTKISVAIILAMGSIASAATIVRIPYVQSLANEADFLYATTDVAIWSCIETGIGIAACSAATLRPLFRVFLSKSRLFGGTPSQPGSAPWPSGAGRSGGYVRSRSRTANEEFGLRSDIGNNKGVTTVIRSDPDVEAGEKRHVRNKSSERYLKRNRGWIDTESGVSSERSSGEAELIGDGIRKTTISKQVVNQLV